MARPSRRHFARLMGGVVTAPLLVPFAIARSEPKVVIVGGGAGGATVAHYLGVGAPDLDITLIEANPIYSSSFFSNLYLGGVIPTLEALNHGYAGLNRLYIKVVHDLASDIDPVRRTVHTKGGRTYSYDRLVLSPGIDIKYDSINGYSRGAARIMPHAYTTDAAQKRLLKRQLQRMRAGGTVAMAMPREPYRCPPGPYERACMIAHFLKVWKPRSKLVILDPKRAFSKQALFMEAFAKYYRGIVELNLSSDTDDFSVVGLDWRNNGIVTAAGKRVRADVANIIPQQRAGAIAARAGCTEGDWCPVHAESFLSRKVPDIHVIGDAAIAADMPKLASSAHSQARVVAADILAALIGGQRLEARYSSACWSLLAPGDSVKAGASYVPGSGRLVASDRFVSQTGEPAEVRRRNYRESVAWYASITDDIFAKTAELPPDPLPDPPPSVLEGKSG